jgi:predicted amidophosphoribosyltransferase
MKKKLRCYFCLNDKNLYSNILCNSCFKNLEKLKWIYCSRCGNENCFGCDQLNEFNNINCIFSYSSGLPEILVLAKDKNDYNAKLLFYDLFFIIIKNNILKILLENEYDYIVFPTLRKERILESNWHPTEFFENIFKSIQSENGALKYKIIRPILLNKSLKQALIPSKKRSAFSNDLKNQKIFLDKNKIENWDKNNNSKILLLDDVLTTGKTSSNNKKMIAEYFHSDKWDLLTIFRSIQKPKA